VARIHPTALVEDGAVLGADVSVGPFCVIGPEVAVGEGSVLHAHVVLAGRTTIGPNARIFPFASIGHEPQDLKYRGEPSTLSIGRNAIIRENVTVNPGTAGGGMVTIIGDDVALLAGAHVAHDCRIGDHVILVNNVMLGGHCTIGDYAILGGGCAVHQWVRIGTHAFVGGMSGLENDLIPFGMALGNRAHLAGLNIVGLRRRDFDRDQVHRLRQAYRLLFAQEGTLKERVEDVAEGFPDDPLIREIVSFIRAGGDRAVCTPGNGERLAPAHDDVAVA
jgi:UDP-N-acetylglucosamine acyltransferase